MLLGGQETHNSLQVEANNSKYRPKLPLNIYPRSFENSDPLSVRITFGNPMIPNISVKAVLTFALVFLGKGDRQWISEKNLFFLVKAIDSGICKNDQSNVGYTCGHRFPSWSRQ